MLLTGMAVASEEPNEPPYFAIRNARIVTGTGRVIDGGTVVLSEGLISAIGRGATIPPEAWVIDGDGLTAYPGLIDSLGNLGLGDEKPARERRGDGRRAARPAMPDAGEQRRSQGPEDRPATTPWRNAADELTSEDKRVEKWRNAGFTSAVSAPAKGILPGQAAFINLAGERPREWVVQAPVALKINLEQQQRLQGYPTSLMGVFAYLRQVFSDAGHYAQAWETYRRNPKGRSRPTYDRALEPLVEARAERWPTLIPATWAKEIHRALALGEELGAKTVVYGAHQGYESADQLAKAKVPVLVSLEWPEKSKDQDPDAEEPLRVLRFRDRAPSTPAALQKAGVPFAFYSDGLSSPKDMLDNARLAVDAGLSKDAALRAFTLSAAEIYGVDDRLGTLEEGKIANVVVTDGDLFEEGTKVKMIFVDGKKYEIREREKSDEEAEAPAGGWK
jgi:imidazolonepropionase-like amidohydrolase